jgi:hypothetical protein
MQSNIKVIYTLIFCYTSITASKIPEHNGGVSHLIFGRVALVEKISYQFSQQLLITAF